MTHEGELNKEKRERFKLVCAVHLILLRNNEILLSRRYNTGYEDGNYSVPAGHLDGNETAASALAREAKEEIGIQILPKHIELAHIMHRISTDERLDLFYIARKWEGEPIIKESDKCDSLAWFPLEELPNNIVPYVKEGIRHTIEGTLYSEFGWE